MNLDYFEADPVDRSLAADVCQREEPDEDEDEDEEEDSNNDESDDEFEGYSE